MAKTFNGSKNSHGASKGKRVRCPKCGTDLIRFLGALRCTELKRGPGGESRRHVKHGSLKTIKSRIRREARTNANA